MRAIRYFLQIGAFVFFATYFLHLVSGRAFPLPGLVPAPATRYAPPAEVCVKPSPIEMLKRVNSGTQ